MFNTRFVQKRLFSSTFKNQLLINNKWVNSIKGETFDTINPSTEETICSIQKAQKEDVCLAVQCAKYAFENGEWSKFENIDRRAFLNKFADTMEKNKAELAEIESIDNGKPIGMAHFDIGLSIDILRYYAGWTEKLHGQTIPMTGPFVSYTKQHPVGVCAQIVPWNFPILMTAFKIAPVLATGCTAILKPAENTSLSALKIGEILLESGMPEGVINILPGFGHEAGEALVQHPNVDKIAFTGSTEIGKHILRESSYTLKRVGLELGGKSPNIIMEDADIDLALAQSNFACFLNSGQFCMAGTRVFVHESIYDKYLEKAVEMANSKKLGGPFEEGVENGPLISQKQLDKVLNYIDIGVKEGAKLMCGGKRVDRKGYFVETTIFADVTDDMTIAKEEIFGPVMSVFKFKDINEVITRANDSPYGLVGGVVTQSLESAMKVSNELKVGQVYVNCWAANQPSTPFGGFKQSGIGRELGQKSLDGYLESKTVIIKTN